MSNEKDQKLNLPKTSIPMKANLNQREPEFLKEWDKRNVYKKIRKNKKPSNTSVIKLFEHIPIKLVFIRICT